MKVYNIFIYTGYVESSSWSCMALNNRKGFDSLEEALQNIGKCLRESCETQEKDRYKPICCKETKANNKDAMCCIKCGERLAYKINKEYLAEDFLHMHRGDMNDGAPCDMWDNLSVNGWALIGGPWLEVNDITNVAVVQEKGEELISQAAYGRLADESPESIEFYKNSAYKSPRDYVQSHVNVPEGMKIFLDE